MVVAILTGKYWDKVDEQCRRKPHSVMLADKNAPNEEVWIKVTLFPLRYLSERII